jgi:hypothetical protein
MESVISKGYKSAYFSGCLNFPSPLRNSKPCDSEMHFLARTKHWSAGPLTIIITATIIWLTNWKSCLWVLATKVWNPCFHVCQGGISRSKIRLQLWEHSPRLYDFLISQNFVEVGMILLPYVLYLQQLFRYPTDVTN